MCTYSGYGWYCGNQYANCDDGNECTLDDCFTVTGCTHDPVQNYISCNGGNGVCINGDCSATCEYAGGLCYSSPPTNSVSVNGWCASSVPYCRTCPSSYPVYNPSTNACEQGQNCVPNAWQCDASTTPDREHQCVLSGGYWNWGSWVNCAAGQVCINDRCGTSLPTTCTWNSVTYQVGQTRCTGSSVFTCINTAGGAAWDAGTACPGTTTCVGNSCGCTAPLANCNNVCVNKLTDPNNCGTCGNVCTGGRSCVAGSCQCAAPLTWCGSACVNTQTNPNNCGTCGHVCSGSTPSCSGGSCVCTSSSCPAGQQCGLSGQCVPCTETCASHGYVCGTFTFCGASVTCGPSSQPCYEGPPGTVGIGICLAGTKTCSAAGSWGSCIGQTLPTNEICNGLNDDCDAQTDEGTCQTGNCIYSGGWVCGTCTSPDQCHEQPDNLCTTDNCVSGACTHVNLANGALCLGGNCEAPAGDVSTCKAACANSYWCASTQPAYATLFDALYCAGIPQCWGCSSPYSNCGNACVNLQSSNTNCGTCGNACTAAQTCYQGSCCTPSCPNPATVNCAVPIIGSDGCGGTCSGIGTKCGAGYSCTADGCVMDTVAIVDTLSPDLVVANSQFTIEYDLTPVAFRAQ